MIVYLLINICMYVIKRMYVNYLVDGVDEFIGEMLRK